MSSEPLVYRTFDQRELDREYSPSSRVEDLPALLRDYAEASAAVREALEVRTDLAYGPGAAERLDFFPSTEPGAPLQVFVHGGYWQELGKDSAAFAAEGFVAAGAAFAAVGYGLAPEHHLDTIVDQVRRALWWLVGHAEELGVDPRRVHVSGHCAGAQLVAMALLRPAPPGKPEPADVFAGATLLSGVYDLLPVRRSYVNDALGLDDDAAVRNSPIRLLGNRLPPLVVARGGVETSEFARQHDDFARAAVGRSPRVKQLVIDHRNHFDLPFDLADPATALGRVVLGEMRLVRPASEPENSPTFA
ncbi:alpha/beta hydrolase [Actinosynnema sp. NPDC020468]|uniref:alpha/beta hydrolase n=1 Tax=Actinosynnema sp. NPDC020468 TaxID=3154488 RepID=UPI0033F73408